MFEYDYFVPIVILEINERRYAKRTLPLVDISSFEGFWTLDIINFKGRVSIKLKKSKGEGKGLRNPGNFRTMRKDDWLVTTGFDFPPQAGRVFEEQKE